MVFSTSTLLTQEQLLDSISPYAVGEHIFVKSCQFVLLFLTNANPPWGETRRINPRQPERRPLRLCQDELRN